MHTPSFSVTKQTVSVGCCRLPALPIRALSEGLASVFPIHVLSQLGDSSAKCIAAGKEEAVEEMQEIYLFAGGAALAELAR